MISKLYFSLLACMIFFDGNDKSCYAQGASSTQSNDLIVLYDFSNLWMLDSIEVKDSMEGVEDVREIKRPEPLGFIGDNYQRFYIHFISSIQNPQDRSEYYVYGKTKVKENICSFQGKIQVNSLILYDRPLFEGISQGYITGTYNFFEDPDQWGSGQLVGKFKTHFYVDADKNVQYDAIEFYADGYTNNQFKGTWTSYTSSSTKQCNWGDFRIPKGFPLDIGAGEFSVNDKYKDNGWENYLTASDICCEKKNNPEVKKAYAQEQEKWWKDD